MTLGGPVTGDLHGLCRTAAKSVACALQPCDTRVSPWAIYPGVIRETPLRIQATGRRGGRDASPSARSLTGRRSAGRGYRNCRSKGHCSYQGDCRHARTVILVPSFHLAPLSTCLGRRLVLRGAFVPFTLNTNQGGVSLQVILKVFFRLQRKAEGTGEFQIPAVLAAKRVSARSGPPCTRQNYSETRFTAKKAPKPSLQHVLRHPIKPAVALGDYRRGKPAGPASRAGTSTCRNHGARTNRDGRTRGIPESVLVVQPYLAHPSAGAQLALEGVSSICHPSVGGAVPNRRTIVQMRERFPNKYGNQAVVQYATSL